jgi:alkylation response protein AidB-like acyl-CoA dehydrogenase
MNFELSEEQVMFRKMAREFAEREMVPFVKEYEREHKINMGLIKKLGDLGLIGMHLPEKYGGLGLDLVTAAVVWEQLSWASWTQTLTSLASGVLAGTVLSNAASEEQRQKYVPAICRGDLIVAVAAVEATAGCDAGAIETSATPDGDSWVINGTKLFITVGSICDVVIVLAQTDKSLGRKGLALIAVEKGTPGFSSTLVDMVGDKAGDVSNLYFSDCRVPKENLIGGIGRGLQNALIGIDMARVFISSSAIGMAKSCLDASITYAKDRCQFGRPIGSFQLVQETLARMHAEIETTRWQVYYAAELKSKGASHAKELSAAKWLSTDLAVRAATEAIKLHGAYGCTDEYPFEHHYRDAILSNILGGTAEMHKLNIGRELLEINAMT